MTDLEKTAAAQKLGLEMLLKDYPDANEENTSFWVQWAYYLRAKDILGFGDIEGDSHN